MSEFSAFLTLGFEHISDINGYDHILFIIVLCAIYSPADWKQVLVLITAFTLGHSVTLALATLEIIPVNPALIEFLIPVTILLTAIFNYGHKTRKAGSRLWLRYATALFFGLIHGMGFSNFLKSLLGRDESIVVQLLAFNLGLELGQIAIVLVIMVLAFAFVQVLNTKKREWNLVLSSAAGGIAFTMILERFPQAFQ